MSESDMTAAEASTEDFEGATPPDEEAVFAQLRVLEALIFAADAPVAPATLQGRLGRDADLATLVARLQSDYAGRGIELVTVAGGYAFRTASDIAATLRGEKPPESRKPPRAATETLAIIAYHQPVTRAEIEAIRGVQVSRGTLDILLEAEWIRPGRRRETPGRPLTWLTTQKFLEQFGLASLRDLPGVEELKAAGLLDSRPVLATLAAEDQFAPVADRADGDAPQDNDHLPAGDEVAEEADFEAGFEDAWEARFAAAADGETNDSSDDNADLDSGPHRLAAAAQ